MEEIKVWGLRRKATKRSCTTPSGKTAKDHHYHEWRICNGFHVGHWKWNFDVTCLTEVKQDVVNAYENLKEGGHETEIVSFRVIPER